MSRLIVHIALCVALLAAGCEEKEKRASQYSLAFLVTDDRGDKLKSVSIEVGQTRIGVTNDEGALHADVRAKDGERFPLHASCPDGYDLQQKVDEVIFLDIRGLTGEKNAAIELRIVCKRQVQIAAVLVNADGHEGMPILVDGIRYGKTGAGGYAHVRFEGRPDTHFEISLDTSAIPTLVPQNPRQEMQLGREDGLFVFEPMLSESEPVRKSKPHGRRTRRRQIEDEVPKRRRPIKIE